MNSYIDKLQENKNQKSLKVTQKKSSNTVTSKFSSQHPATVAQMQLQEIANNSEQVKRALQFQTMANTHSSLPIQKKGKEDEELQMKSIDHTTQLAGIDKEELLQGKFEPIQRMEKPNNTGLPNQLKAGIENLSGMSMDHVKVHYNSDKPAQLQAHAYAQGSEIHIAPGQEQHLPHEAWHIVQQAQGRVKPTMQMKGNVPVNDDAGLETEADVMGAKALDTASASPIIQKNTGNGGLTFQDPLQKKENDILVTQLVRAYRVGTSASKYKIAVKDGKITNFQGGSSGIDISFGDDTHANYYFETKKGDTGTEMVSWDFPNPFYHFIIEKMNGSQKKKDAYDSAIWKEVWNISAPVNSSDGAVREERSIAPHFGKDWIDPLNSYGKGTNAHVTTYEQFFDEEEPVAPFPDDEIIYMYKKDKESQGLVVAYGDREDYASGTKDWLYASKATATANGWANDDDFD